MYFYIGQIMDLILKIILNCISTKLNKYAYKHETKSFYCESDFSKVFINLTFYIFNI